MKYPVSFFVIILITFSFNNAKSEDLLIAYINMEKVMNVDEVVSVVSCYQVKLTSV